MKKKEILSKCKVLSPFPTSPLGLCTRSSACLKRFSPPYLLEEKLTFVVHLLCARLWAEFFIYIISFKYYTGICYYCMLSSAATSSKKPSWISPCPHRTMSVLFHSFNYSDLSKSASVEGL